MRIPSWLFPTLSADGMAGWANEFMEDCASRIRGRVQITTDGHRAYLDAVENAFGADIDYAHAPEDLRCSIR